MGAPRKMATLTPLQPESQLCQQQETIEEIVSTLTSWSGFSCRALSKMGVLSFAIHRAAATIPQWACPSTRLLIPPSCITEWWKGTTAPVAAVNVSLMLWVPRIRRRKHFESLSHRMVNAGFKSCKNKLWS